MDSFWVGFYKRADILHDWQEESEQADKDAKQKKEPAPDMLRMLGSMPPDQYWRPWP